MNELGLAVIRYVFSFHSNHAWSGKIIHTECAHTEHTKNATSCMNLDIFSSLLFYSLSFVFFLTYYIKRKSRQHTFTF